MSKTIHIPWVDPSKPLPPWLQRYVNARLVGLADEYAAEYGATYQRSCEYYLTLRLRTPPWVTRADIAPFYIEAEERRQRGQAVEVDHIIPLNGENIIGLHCPANLAVISRLRNAQKSNHYYPGMQNEQLTLFDEHPQTELDL